MKLKNCKIRNWVMACFAISPFFASAQTVNINVDKQYQTIRGFGGINFPSWTGGDLTESQRATAFGNGDGQLGLSVLRIHVDPNNNNWY